MRILVVNSAEWGAEHRAGGELPDVADWITSAFGDGDGARFIVWRPQREPSPPVGPFDGIILSGSAASAYDPEPWIPNLTKAILAWIDAGWPMIGLCFGHQIIAQALGGRVEKNPKGWELGRVAISLTPAGSADALYAGVPSPFNAMESHQDVVTEIPKWAECLAESPICACQSMKIGDAVRTVQFHPEYDEAKIRYLVGPRRERLTKAGVDVDAVLAGLGPTPDGARVLQNFKERFILRNSAGTSV